MLKGEGQLQALLTTVKLEEQVEHTLEVEQLMQEAMLH